MRGLRFLLPAVIAAVVALPGCRKPVEALRVGYQADFGAAPALLGFATDGFEGHVPIPVRAMAFGAGPSVMDALFSGKVDVGYMDPVAAINAFARSRGEFVIVAGSSVGGASLVLSTTSIVTLEGLRAARLATPQLGSSQDVSARQFFSELGFVSREQGGEFQVVPVANLDMAALFRRQDVAAAWAMEPWASTLVHEASGTVLASEAELWARMGGETPVTCVVVASRRIIENEPRLIEGFLSGHVAMIEALETQAESSRALVADHLSKVVRFRFGAAILNDAWRGISHSPEIHRDAIERHAYNAYRIGFLGASMPRLSEAIVEAPLARVLAAR